MNHVLLQGDVRVAPVLREIDGASAVSFDIVAPTAAGKTVAIPVLWPVSKVPEWLVEGATVAVSGEVYRRFFFANGQRNSLVDVTASDVVKATPAKLRRTIDSHIERVAS